MADEFDLVVIGAGPGGYVAAIKAAQLGMKVAVVEKESLGGTCLNVGCIPSKALLHSSELFEEAKHEMADHGIKLGKPSLDLSKMMKRKNTVVGDLVKGIGGLFAKNKITPVTGEGAIESAGRVAVTNKGKKQTLACKNILIATGSEVISLPGIKIDEKRIVSSTGALELKSVPKRMVVIGGGVIGLELGSVWRRLGAEVTVVEFLDRIVPGLDLEIAKNLQKFLEKQGIKFRLSTKVVSAKADSKCVKLEMEAASGGKKEKLDTDVVLVAVGRRPYTDGLGLDKCGVKIDDRGRVEIDGHFQTNVKGIYAIGDVVRGAMLAHKAEEEGIACVEIMNGQAGHVNYNAIPNVIYTNPEVATVGKSEDELKQEGVKYKTGKFPFLANSRARATGNTDGFVKVIVEPNTDEILGVHIIGPDAGTLIAEAVLALEYRASAEDIARTCHAHPTLNEAFKEAALNAYSKAINM